MNLHLKTAVAGCVAVLACGCASVTGNGSLQTVSVQTFSDPYTEIEGAKCGISNDEGTWFISTPGTAVVHRSNKDLQVVCKKAETAPGSANVASKTKYQMWGNIIRGGGLGVLVDHSNGTGYEYPNLIKVYMGSNKTPAADVNTDASSAIQSEPGDPLDVINATQ